MDRMRFWSIQYLLEQDGMRRPSEIVADTYAVASFNPIDTGRFFDACVPGGGEKTPPLKINFYATKTRFLFMR